MEVMLQRIGNVKEFWEDANNRNKCFLSKLANWVKLGEVTELERYEQTIQNIIIQIFLELHLVECSMGSFIDRDSRG